MSLSPTQKSLALLEALGFIPQVVEKWIPGANVRKDLYGFADIFACCSTGSVMFVQTGALSAHSTKVKNIDKVTPLQKQALMYCNAAGITMVVLTWSTVKNKTTGRLRHRVKSSTLSAIQSKGVGVKSYIWKEDGPFSADIKISNNKVVLDDQTSHISALFFDRLT